MLDFIDNIVSTVTTIIVVIVIAVVVFFIYLMFKSKEAQEQKEIEQSYEEQRQKNQEANKKEYWATLSNRYNNLPDNVIDECADLLYEMKTTDTSDWNRCLELKEAGIELYMYTDRYCEAKRKLKRLLQKYQKDTDITYYELDLRYIMDVLID